MPLTSAQIAEVTAFTPAQMREAIDVYQTAHTTAGTVRDVNPLSQFELRLLDILAQKVPAQFAVTPLIAPQNQAMADRLNGAMAGGLNNTAPGFESLSTWTTATPPLPITYAFGDLQNSAKKVNLPAIIVTSTLPGGEESRHMTIGTTHDVDTTVYIYYMLSYVPSFKRQLEALRGAEAIANILITYQQDCEIGWQNGKPTSVQRLVGAFKDGGEGPSYLGGVVQFTCTRRLAYMLQGM